MPFAQGEVLVLPFPYTDRLAEKRRPAVVVSKPALERAHGLVWVAMITSGTARKNDVAVSDLARAGLTVASVVRPAKLATIEPHRVLRAAGKLNKSDLAETLEVIAHFL
jgi:mRNA interferase MazF